MEINSELSITIKEGSNSKSLNINIKKEKEEYIDENNFSNIL